MKTNKELYKQLKEDKPKLGEIKPEINNILNAVKSYLNGEGIQKKISARFKVSEHKISRWTNAYRDMGLEGLKQMMDRVAKEAKKADTSNDPKLAKQLKGEILQLGDINPEIRSILNAVVSYLNGEDVLRELVRNLTINKTTLAKHVINYRDKGLEGLNINGSPMVAQYNIDAMSIPTNQNQGQNERKRKAVDKNPAAQENTSTAKNRKISK